MWLYHSDFFDFIDRFINERIESLVISVTCKADKGVSPSEQELSRQKPNVSSKTSSDQFSRFLDQSVKGVELVQVKHDKAVTKEVVDEKKFQKDPLLSADPRSSHTWNSLPEQSQVGDEKEIQRHHSGGEWGQMLDMLSQRKSRALAPEHFENMWTKGRNYKRKEGLVDQTIKKTANSSSTGNNGDHSTSSPKQKLKAADGIVSESNALFTHHSNGSKAKLSHVHPGQSLLIHPPGALYEEHNEHELGSAKEIESDGDSSYTTEDDETSGVTGLDSPGTKVWDSKHNRNAVVSHIRHPLESSDGHMGKKIGKGLGQYRRAPRTKLGRKRSRLTSEKIPSWQEVERTSFLLGDGQDILNTGKGNLKEEESSDEPESESWGRSQSGAATSSSTTVISEPDLYNSLLHSPENSVLEGSFLKLRCEVVAEDI